MDPLFTTHDVARLVSVDPSTVSKWIDRGLLIAFKTPGGHRRIRQADLLSFLRQHEMPIPPELGAAVVRLLVVDKDKVALDGIKRALKGHADKLELQLATSGLEALLLAAELRPHGVLIDLGLPDFDVLEAVRAIRARPALSGTRVLTMTGKPRADVVAKSTAAGAVACLAKPIDPDALLEVFRVPMAFAG